MTSKILLVEKNESYRNAAKEYFSSLKEGVELVFAHDYKSAMEKITTPGLDGIITDLFFPRETGSQDRSLGKAVFDDIMMRAQDTGRGEYHPNNIRYNCINQAIEKSADNQPLGILVAREADWRDIPFALLVTSTDIVTSTLNAHEIGERGKPTVSLNRGSRTWYNYSSVGIVPDIHLDRESLKFWEYAYKTLRFDSEQSPFNEHCETLQTRGFGWEASTSSSSGWGGRRCTHKVSINLSGVYTWQ